MQGHCRYIRGQISLCQTMKRKQIEAQTQGPFQWNATGIVTARFGTDSFCKEKWTRRVIALKKKKKAPESYKHEIWQYMHKIYSKTLWSIKEGKCLHTTQLSQYKV